MDFSATEEQRFIQESAARFSQQHLAPNAAALDQNPEGEKQHFLARLKQLADIGFMGLNIDSQYGGSEAGVVGFSLALTELARGCAATAVTVSVTNMAAEIIQACGSEQQKNHYLPKICSGEYSAAGFCLTESSAGSDPASMRCRATRDGEGWRLNGTKVWITSAEYAGVFIVWAVTDPDAPRGKGISCFLVEASTAGVSVAKREHKMGQSGSATNQVTFEDCWVADTALLGELNRGFAIAMGELAGGRIGIASLALGVGSAALDYARSYIVDREQFGRKLSDFQGLQWQLADRYTELEAARLLVLQAAWIKEQGRDFAKQASMAKLFASEKANEACYTAIQLLGGNGYSAEYPVERMARDARITTIYEGTSEIQRVIISRQLLAELD